ncbi:hypothetical protein [Photorhabdus temperata]|nr:hypothetical protein [Photorhabdus temperata]
MSYYEKQTVFEIQFLFIFSAINAVAIVASVINPSFRTVFLI